MAFSTNGTHSCPCLPCEYLAAVVIVIVVVVVVFVFVVFAVLRCLKNHVRKKDVLSTTTSCTDGVWNGRAKTVHAMHDREIIQIKYCLNQFNYRTGLTTVAMINGETIRYTRGMTTEKQRRERPKKQKHVRKPSVLLARKGIV